MSVHPNSLANLIPQPPFTGADDPRRITGAMKGHKSFKNELAELLEMTPREFYKMFGRVTIPPQYSGCKTMRRAVATVLLGMSLGHLKGSKQSLKAADIIMDRTDGKVSQHLDITTDMTEKDFREMSTEALKKIAETGKVD